MQMRNVGKSGLKVSELCLGTMTFGGKGVFNQIGNIDIKEAKELVDISLDSGINFFDTSDAYSQGESEIILGKALGSKRKNSIICTKVRFDAGGEGPNDQGSSRYHIINACNDSLRRLGTDYIDIYMLHGFDIHTPLEESLKTMDDLVRSGKVRYVGCSNYSAWHMMKALAVSEKQNLEKFITYQGYYSLLGRELENEIIPLSLDQGVGIMVWSPLSGGYLTGKFNKNKPFPKGTRIGDHKISPFIPPANMDKTFKIIDKMEEIANNHKASIAQTALNYLLKKPAVSTLVLGIRKKEQLIDNINTLKWELSEEEMGILDKLSDSPSIYPYWHQISTGVNI
jgi:aryl-alcohol dehydrogenase-like predicted oxidoreductase